MIFYKDKKYGFYEIFNEDNGTLIRSDVNGVDPVMRSFPELLDVGIMGHCNSKNICTKAGIDCYQNGNQRNTPHMSIEDFEIITRQACGKTFQIALGGAGDPNKHTDFKTILEISRYYRIVPNLTTSGLEMTESEISLIKNYCGAVAVSWYSRLRGIEETNPHTIEASKKLVQCNCIVNVHFVISVDTIDEAIYRLEHNLFPNGINAVIFILYKPVGQGQYKKVLSANDDRVERLIRNVQMDHPFRIGFDTCFTSAILRYGTLFSPLSIDSCEAATFSMYIDSQMNCYPCSFGIWQKNISESLRNKTIKEVWESDLFSSFRKKEKSMCKGCEHFVFCRSGCKIGLDIDLCDSSLCNNVTINYTKH